MGNKDRGVNMKKNIDKNQFEQLLADKKDLQSKYHCERNAYLLATLLFAASGAIQMLRDNADSSMGYVLYALGVIPLIGGLVKHADMVKTQKKIDILTKMHEKQH